ncbi:MULTISPECIES: hypothetical protein [unclassified Neorhizobium]|nr:MULTISPECIES: hypothetical protein [unclassified Neorhizobium]
MPVVWQPADLSIVALSPMHGIAKLYQRDIFAGQERVPAPAWGG